jgi:hypothetical protein
VEEKTACPHEEVANKGNKKDRIMTVRQTIPYAFGGKVHEQ